MHGWPSRLATCLALLIAFSSPFLVAPAEADTGPWSTPINLSDDQYLSWWPAISADLLGNVHVVWATSWERPNDKVRSGTDVLVYRKWDGKEWSKPNAIATSPLGWVMRSALDAGASGDLHLSYRDRDSIYYRKAPVEDAWAAQAWSPPRKISEYGDSYAVRLVEDSNGIIHAVWNEGVGACSQCNKVFYRRSEDGGQTWSPRTTITSGLAQRVQLEMKVDGQGRVHVLWEDVDKVGNLVSASHVVSANNASSWSPAFTFSAPAGKRSAQPAVGVDGQGNTIAVWRAKPGNEIYHQISTDGGTSFSQPVQLPGIIARPENDPPLDAYDMATDSAGNVHLVAVGRASPTVEQVQVYHLEWNGTAWTGAQALFNGPDYAEFPKITISGGNQLHAAWFTRDKKFQQEGANYEIWYATAPTTSPAKQVTRITRSTPASRATVVAQRLSSPVAAPITGQAAVEPTGENWQRSAFEPLAYSSAIVAVMLGLVIAVRVRRLPWRR